MTRSAEYIRIQRQLGEINAAITLTNAVHKAMHGDPDFARAVRALLVCKAKLLSKVIEMEG